MTISTGNGCVQQAELPMAGSQTADAAPISALYHERGLFPPVTVGTISV